MWIGLFIIVFIMGWLLTGVLRRYALHKSIIDIPNQRSSHQVPTPRGGGIVFVFIFCTALLGLVFFHHLATHIALALLGGGILTAYVGYYDDVKKLKAKWRCLAHLAAALWVLYWLGGFPVLNFGSFQVYAGWLGGLFAILAIIWGINLYNFMDGIDGFAGSQGVMTSLIAGWIFFMQGDQALAILSGVLAVALIAFLCWNWRPAKIFMGDVGSGFLGFVFATLALYSVNQHATNLVFWAIILSLYIYDATLTLLYRLYRKQAWYEAHRDHAYQQWIIAGFSHQQVTLGLIFLNAIIFFPLGLVVYYWPQLALRVLIFISLVQIFFWGYARFYARKHRD